MHLQQITAIAGIDRCDRSESPVEVDTRERSTEKD